MTSAKIDVRYLTWLRQLGETVNFMVDFEGCISLCQRKSILSEENHMQIAIKMSTALVFLKKSTCHFSSINLYRNNFKMDFDSETKHMLINSRPLDRKILVCSW